MHIFSIKSQNKTRNILYLHFSPIKIQYTITGITTRDSLEHQYTTNTIFPSGNFFISFTFLQDLQLCLHAHGSLTFLERF